VVLGIVQVGSTLAAHFGSHFSHTFSSFTCV